MKRAILFPGQGSEQPRMGLDVIELAPRARELLLRASSGVGVDLRREITRSGAALDRTEILQPALVAVCLGIWEVLKQRGVTFEIAAGHSLGEIGAWSACGFIGSESAVDLAVIRGNLMSREARAHPGGMVALRASSESEVRDACLDGQLSVAAHNTPNEWVLSGPTAAINALMRNPNATKLRVAGAWHSPAMEGASRGWEQALRDVTPGVREALWIANSTASIVNGREAAIQALASVLTTTLRWAESMTTLANCSIDEYWVVGPSKVMRGLIRRNLGGNVIIRTIEDSASLDEACRSISQ